MTVITKVTGLALGGLVLAGLATRGRPTWRPPWRNPPGTGVREPRRPLQPSGSAAAAAEPPSS